MGIQPTRFSAANSATCYPFICFSNALRRVQGRKDRRAKAQGQHEPAPREPFPHSAAGLPVRKRPARSSPSPGSLREAVAGGGCPKGAGKGASVQTPAKPEVGNVTSLNDVNPQPPKLETPWLSVLLCQTRAAAALPAPERRPRCVQRRDGQEREH